MTTQPKPLTLRDHEVKQLLSGEVLVVRPVKPQPAWNAELEMWVWPNALHGYASCYPTDGLIDWLTEHSPYPVGSRWWVREAFCVYAQLPQSDAAPLGDVDILEGPLNGKEPLEEYWRRAYRADYPTDPGDGWRSAITMPRWASRLTVEVVENGVNRVQEIGEDMAVECGVSFFSAVANGYTCRGALAVLWDRHNPQFPYDSNPWTWTTRVRRIQ
jgi:hypothetical protein